MSQSTKITDYFKPLNQVQPSNNTFPIEGRDYTLHFDGGSRGNPGPGGCGWVIRKGGVEIYAGLAPLGECTNNYAEYKALEQGLKSALDKGYTRLSVYGDSLLVINQVMGVWKCNARKLVPILKNVNELKSEFEEIEFAHVMRDQNKRADALANEAMDIQNISNLSLNAP